jgi:proteasome lid subunit RPN8/RPN11
MLQFAEDIVAHAKENPQEEVCGFIIQRAEGMLEAVRATNIWPEPSKGFQIDPVELLKQQARGRVLAIYHSHPYDPALASLDDRKYSEEHGLPYFIYSLPDNQLRAYVPPNMKRDPIEGRVYFPLVYNCLTLCVDYYREVLGIYLEPLEMEYTEDSLMNRKLMDYIKRNGFERFMDKPQAGDIIIMTIHSGIPDHAGIYVGHSEMLHHRLNHRSERTPYGGIWEKATTYFLRHSSKI